MTLVQCHQRFQGYRVPFRKTRPRCTSGVRQAVGEHATLHSALPDIKQWIGAKGVGVSKVDTAAAVDDTQLFLVSSKDITSGEAVLSVPDNLWITESVVQSSPIGKALSGLERWLQLACFLISETNSPNSTWKPYVALRCNSPLLWSNEQLSRLAGTQLLQNLQGYRTFFDAKFVELQQGVFAANPALFPASVFTRDAFMAAVATVRASVHTPLDADKLALVPLADAVSHRRAANVGWKVKGAGLLLRSEALVVEATRNVRKGERLAMDYGPGKPDNAVLLDYGVLDTETKKPGYILTLTLPESDRFFDDKADILESAGLRSSVPFTLELSEPPPENMMAMLRLIHLSGPDSFLLESVFRNDVWDHMQQPVTSANESAACSAMIDGSSAALARYSSSVDADLAELRSGTLARGSREDMAVRVRLGEKEVLESVRLFFESRLGEVDRLQYYQERRLKRLGLLDDEGRTTYDTFFKDGIA